MAWTNAQVKEIFRQAAIANGLDVAISLAQINQESGFRANAVGPPTNYGTAKGAAQFIDDTWKRYGSGSPFDPTAAAKAWARFMKELLGKFNGRWDLALAAYNGGPGRSILQTVLKSGKPLTAFPKTPTWTNSSIHQQSWNYANLILKAAGKSGAPVGPGPVATTPGVAPAPVDPGLPGDSSGDVTGEDLNAGGGDFPTSLIIILAAGAVAYFFFFQNK